MRDYTFNYRIKNEKEIKREIECVSENDKEIEREKVYNGIYANTASPMGWLERGSSLREASG